MHNIELLFPIEPYSYHLGGTPGTIWWLWRASCDSEDSDVAASNLRIHEVNKQIPVYQTRAMHREFVERFELVCNTSRTVLSEMYRLVSGDSSACANTVSTVVQKRLLPALNSQDADIVFDLHHLNEGRHGKYD